MRITFDTNVVLDVLLGRKAFLSEASALFAYVHEDRISGLLCATTLTTVFYLIERKKGTAGAYQGLDRLLALFEATPVDDRVLRRARTLDFDDYEDAVLHESARQGRADGIVTRNTEDFKDATLTIYEPAELLAVIESRSANDGK